MTTPISGLISARPNPNSTYPGQSGPEQEFAGILDPPHITGWVKHKGRR
ncbi:hypothetical protein [Dokdonella sp.]